MSIEDCRAEIDAIDGELLRLLNERARLALLVGESKKAAGLALCDKERERAVLERARGANRGPLDERAVTNLFRLVIEESRRVQARAMGLALEGEGEAL